MPPSFVNVAKETPLTISCVDITPSIGENTLVMVTVSSMAAPPTLQSRNYMREGCTYGTLQALRLRKKMHSTVGGITSAASTQHSYPSPTPPGQNWQCIPAMFPCRILHSEDSATIALSTLFPAVKSATYTVAELVPKQVDYLLFWTKFIITDGRGEFSWFISATFGLRLQPLRVTRKLPLMTAI